MREPAPTQRPLMMFGESDAEVCVDGVCAAPEAVPSTSDTDEGGSGAQTRAATGGDSPAERQAHQTP